MVRCASVAVRAMAACAIIVCTGCQPGIGATATGVVSFKGKPAPAGIMVRFQPQVPDSSASIGVTDANGRYDLRFNARTRGVLPGESIVSLAVVAEPDPQGTPSMADPLRNIVIPPAYGDLSTLRKTVRPGHNEIDIDVAP